MTRHINILQNRPAKSRKSVDIAPKRWREALGDRLVREGVKKESARRVWEDWCEADILARGCQVTVSALVTLRVAKDSRPGLSRILSTKTLPLGQIRPHEKLPFCFSQPLKRCKTNFIRRANTKPALRSCHRVAPRQRLTAGLHVLNPKILSKKPVHTGKESKKGLRAQRVKKIRQRAPPRPS